MKRSTIKPIIILISLIFLSAILFNGNLYAKKVRLSIATAGTAGTWYPLGGAIANLITKYVKNAEATAYPSGASIENIRTLRKGQCDIAFLMPDVAYWAYTGTKKFKKEKPFKELRGLFSLYPIDEMIVVPEDSPIKSIYDIKGKRVGIGAPGSGIEVMNKLILAEYGITYKDISPKFLSIAESVQALKDGNIDVAMFAVGTPAPGLMDLVTVRKVRYIDIKDDMAKKINKKYPYYVPRTIPAGIYKGQDKPIHVLCWLGIIATTTRLNKDLVYNIVKTFWDHKKEIDKIHVKYKSIKINTAAKGCSIPLHDGAKRFFKEKGVLK
ncbi:MAG: TAXI family TRAP transporter solute-binding subunit [Deltaproteobacteria bacterium]|nr:TAXI family TRAP transporter solute-binding subunit [Deltaproteobacteria bacterium]